LPQLDQPPQPQPRGPGLGRRRLLGATGALTALAALLVAGCSQPGKWHNVDISGSLPALDFTMTRATDGTEVTQADYRGRIVLLYFGYTLCPDVCPATLTNLAAVFDKIGPTGMQQVRTLFATVDPNRDSLDQLRRYTALFSPDIAGIRGTPDQLAALARRCRVAYSVTPATASHPYQVTHSSAIYVFDGSGDPRLLIPSMASSNPDIAGTADDIKHLIRDNHPEDLLGQLLNMV
jgi:protein SCO1